MNNRHDNMAVGELVNQIVSDSVGLHIYTNSSPTISQGYNGAKNTETSN